MVFEEMGGEEGTSNGDTEWLKREELNNGCGVRVEHDFFYGSSSLGEGFRTYKRRKHANSSSEGKSLEDWTSSVETADKNTEQVCYHECIYGINACKNKLVSSL